MVNKGFHSLLHNTVCIVKYGSSLSSVLHREHLPERELPIAVHLVAVVVNRPAVVVRRRGRPFHGLCRPLSHQLLMMRIVVGTVGVVCAAVARVRLVFLQEIEDILLGLGHFGPGQGESAVHLRTSRFRCHWDHSGIIEHQVRIVHEGLVQVPADLLADGLLHGKVSLQVSDVALGQGAIGVVSGVLAAFRAGLLGVFRRLLSSLSGGLFCRVFGPVSGALLGSGGVRRCVVVVDSGGRGGSVVVALHGLVSPSTARGAIVGPQFLFLLRVPVPWIPTENVTNIPDIALHYPIVIPSYINKIKSVLIII